MPQIPFVSSVIAWFTGLPAIVQGMITSYAINKVCEELGMYDQDFSSASYERGVKANNTKNTYPIPIVYGERIVGGSEYRSIEGEDNKHLHRILCLCEGEIDSIPKVFLNDKDIDTIPEYNALVRVDKHTGEESQTVNTNALSEITKWDSSMTANGLAYIHMRLTFDRDVFTSIPKFTALVKGKKVYDPRDNTQAQNNPNSYKWSDNPVLCILDYLTNTVYGRGISYDLIDIDSFKDEADYCDETFEYKDSNNQIVEQKRYTCNGVINPDDKALDNIKKLCSSCRAVIIPPAEKYVIAIDRPAVASFTFNEDNIVGRVVLSGGSLREKKNQARVRFFDKNNNYDEAIHVTSSQDFIKEDNDQLLTAELKYSMTDSYTRANYLSHVHLKSSREHWKIQFIATLEAIQVKVMDVVYIKSKLLGWDSGSLEDGKLFRVSFMEFLPDDTIRIQAEEYDSSVYTPSLDTPPTQPDTNLPSVFETKPVTNLQASSAEEDGGLAIANDGTLISQIFVTWDKPSLAYIMHYEVDFAMNLPSGLNRYSRATTTDTQFFCSPVADKRPYLIRVRAVYITGRKSEYTSILHIVESKSRKPIRPASLSFSVGREFAQVLHFELNTDERDVAGYKIKYEDYADGDTEISLINEDAWQNMERLHEGLVLSSPYETNLLPQGAYNFAIKTVDTSGNESETARYLANAVVENSPIKNILDAFYPRLAGWLTVGSIDTSKCEVNEVTGSIQTLGTTEWQDLGTTTFAGATSWDINGTTSDLVYTTNGNFFTKSDGTATELTYRPSIQVQGFGEKVVEIAYSSDGSTFGSYTTSVETVTNKGIKVRVTLTGINATLNSLAILLDGRGIEEEIIEVDTSNLEGTTGVRKIALTNNFNSIRQITATFVGNYAGYSYVVSNKNATNSAGALSPELKIYDSSGNLSDAVLDLFIKGF